MKNHGKKMFPGVNKSNIFFLDNQKSNKKNLDKYINKNITLNNTEKKNSTYKRNNTNNDDIKCNTTKLPMKKRVLKKYNSTTLKKSDIIPFSNKNNTIKKRQLITHKSMDYINPIKKDDSISLTESNINSSFTSKKPNSTLKKIDLNKIKTIKPRRLGSTNKLNISINSNDSTSKNNNNNKRYSSSTFTSFTQRKITKPKDENTKVNTSMLQPKNYYNKFINKNNNVIKEKQKKKNLMTIPKEEIFIIKKEKLDNNIIDIKSLKKNLIGSGINIISLTGISSSLVPINNDSVKLIIDSNEIDSNKLNKMQRILKNKGLKLNELKNNYNKKFSKGIFPAKSKWNDGKYGGRENSEKLELSMAYKRKKDENLFHKKNILSKNFFVDLKYKNNEIKRNKSVEK